MRNNNFTIFWTWEAGRIWATCSDGRRIPTWSGDLQFTQFVELLNAAPPLGTVLLWAWLGAHPAV